MWACRVFGHDYSFRAASHVLLWRCARGCGAGGSKEYDTAAAAERFASAFDRRDTEALGRRAPLVGLLPLRLWRRMQQGLGATRSDR